MAARAAFRLCLTSALRCFRARRFSAASAFFRAFLSALVSSDGFFSLSDPSVSSRTRLSPVLSWSGSGEHISPKTLSSTPQLGLPQTGFPTELRCGSGAAETCAFYRCPSLRLREMGRELSFFQRLRLQGIDPLEVPGKLEVPKGGFWRREPFLSHAARCARGDPGAMMEFAAYLESLGPHEFFPCAANFWRYRAGLYGDPDAARWLRQWMAGHPRQRVPSAARSILRGCMDGRKLRALGFLFFDPERQYRLEEPDSDRIVRVSAWCGGEGPDGDGYGREELYDWWYLDEHLTRLPGVEVIRACSDQETRVLSDRFDTQHEAAVRAVRARSGDHFSCRSGEL